ncbi:uncharacterized protein LOC141601688 [Silene latifolia]|uniref:uncharacterized protein LOC141601688 n=1 Tax=Silene latifolia TaxID=37657 RepID=UPI003D76AD38
MEVLSRYLRVICKQPNVSYHPKCTQLNLTHLIFADDLMIFTRGDIPSVAAVVQVLDNFGRLSGLKANPDKTSIYFGGVHPVVQSAILQFTNFSHSTFPFRYLGVPLNVSRLCLDHFGPLLTKVQGAIHHWTTSFLSYAGRLQLINSVLMGLQTYWCSTILLPKGVIKLLNRSSKNFFWQVTNGCRHMTMKSWKSICFPWIEGGFGIKELLSWNRALLLRWLWQIEHSDGLWARWHIVYALNGSTIWTVKSADRFSESFRSILAVRDFCLQKFGNHNAVQDFLHSCVKHGKFTLTTAYDGVRAPGTIYNWAKALTHPIIIPAHWVTTSLAAEMKLATSDNIIRKGLILVNRCSLCKNNSETHSHLFFHCSYSKLLWEALLSWISIMRPAMDLQREIRWSQSRRHRRHWKYSWYVSSLTVAINQIWHERNLRIFTGQERPVSILLQTIKYTVGIRMIARGHGSRLDALVEFVPS